jgi:hypothetical protein
MNGHIPGNDGVLQGTCPMQKLSFKTGPPKGSLFDLHSWNLKDTGT